MRVVGKLTIVVIIIITSIIFYFHHKRANTPIVEEKKYKIIENRGCIHDNNMCIFMVQDELDNNLVRSIYSNVSEDKKPEDRIGEYIYDPDVKSGYGLDTMYVFLYISILTLCVIGLVVL